MGQKGFPRTWCGKVDLHDGRRGVECNGEDHAHVDTKPQHSDRAEELKIQQKKCDFSKEHRWWG